MIRSMMLVVLGLCSVVLARADFLPPDQAFRYQLTPASEGRVMLTVTADSCGRHDTSAGACSCESNTVRFGHYTKYLHACRDNFILEVSKYGMGKRDIVPNINRLAATCRAAGSACSGWSSVAMVTSRLCGLSEVNRARWAKLNRKWIAMATPGRPLKRPRPSCS